MQRHVPAIDCGKPGASFTRGEYSSLSCLGLAWRRGAQASGKVAREHDVYSEHEFLLLHIPTYAAKRGRSLSDPRSSPEAQQESQQPTGANYIVMGALSRVY
jgi:hypothetical protein